MDHFRSALSAVRTLKDSGVVSDYAVGGAMAFVFWSEALPTYDLDVFVVMRQKGMLVDLSAIYAWAKTHGYRSDAEHIVISGIPVQVIPAHSELASEAVAAAAELEYGGEKVRVITPEYLVALYLEPAARTRKRLERAAALMDEGIVDRRKLDSILSRFKLKLPDR